MARAKGETRRQHNNRSMRLMEKEKGPRYRLDKERSVEVYRNLHRNCYSIKQDGLVKAHADELTLDECTFHVNASGRERVRKAKRKEVHAWIRGFLSPNQGVHLIPPKWFNQIFYNPYKHDHFMHRVETGAMSATFCQIVRADEVVLTPDGVYKL